MTQHADKCVITVKKYTGGSGHEGAFLDLFKQRAIFLFGGTAFGDVPNHVNCAFLFRPLVLIGGSRCNREPAERIRPLRETVFLSAAVGAVDPLQLILGQHRLAKLAHNFRLRLGKFL